MAQLELGINVTGLSEAKAGLESLKAIGETLKSSFSGLSVITQALNAENKKLAGELTRAKIETQQLSTAGKALDNQNKELKNTLEAERVAIAKVTKEQKELTLARAKDRTAPAAKGQYSLLSSELTQMRNEAKNLGAQMLLLSAAGLKTSVTYNTLSNKFKESSKHVVKLDSDMKKLDSSLGIHGRSVGNYEKGQMKANGVAMEFTRIIQDAPFGLMGIGNNIQQLTDNFGTYANKMREAAAEQGKTVSGAQIAKGVFSSMITPTNLLSLGIAAITSGWTAYTMWQQKANKSNKEATSELDKMTSAMSSLGKAMYEANVKGKEELNRLNILRDVYNDQRQSMSQRNNAYKEVMSIYESYFGKLTEEQKKTFNLGKAYDALSVSILKTAKARGYQDAIADNTKKIIALEGAIEKQSNTVIGATNEMNRLTRTEGGLNNVILEGVSSREKAIMAQTGINVATGNLTKELDKQGKLVDTRNKLELQNWKYNQKILDLGVEGAKIADIATKETQKKVAATKELVDYLLKLREITTAAEGSVEIAGATGLDAELAKIRQKYAKWQNDITKLYRDGEKARKAKTFAGDFGTFKKEVAGSKGRLSALEGQELIEATRKYTQETTDWISKLWIDAGREQEKGREQDISNSKDYYDKLLIEHQDNADKITAITAARRFKEEAINQKWDNKALEDVNKIADKITSLERGEFKGKRTDAITKELQRRLYEINAFYDEIEKVLNLNKLDTSGISEARSNSNKEATTQGDLAIKNLFENVKINSDKVVSSFRASIGSIIGDIGSLGTKFSEVFSNVFSKLTTGLNDVIIGSFLDELTLKLKDRLAEMGDAGQKMSNAAAGMAIAGQMLGSAFSKTSVGGQGLAGGLKGAASGAMAGVALGGKTGGIWGAAIGGALGIFQGILGAKQAKKQEELQRRQLEEQKKANSLLERMNALAYASQIIGSKTQYGIVHGVNRNAFGEITFRVQGQDLVATLNRQDALNGRK